MFNHRNSKRLWHVRSIMITLALLFTLFLFGQPVLAENPWADEPPMKQGNKPTSDVDESPWCDDPPMKQGNKPTTDVDPWVDDPPKKQLNKPDLNTPAPGYLDILWLCLLY